MAVLVLSGFQVITHYAIISVLPPGAENSEIQLIIRTEQTNWCPGEPLAIDIDCVGVLTAADGKVTVFMCFIN